MPANVTPRPATNLGMPPTRSTHARRGKMGIPPDAMPPARCIAWAHGRHPEQLHRLVTGYQVSQAVHVAATLGLCDLLADGPRSVAELAEATGADARSLTRLMRALAAVGLYVSDGDERFANTELGDAFRADAPRSVAGWARLSAGRSTGRRMARWSTAFARVRTRLQLSTGSRSGTTSPSIPTSRTSSTKP